MLVFILVSSNNHFYKPFLSDVINECDCKPTSIIKSAFHNRCHLAKFTGKISCISFRPLAYRLPREETGIKPQKMNADFCEPMVSLVEAKSFYRQIVKICLSKLFSYITKNPISVKNCCFYFQKMTGENQQTARDPMTAHHYILAITKTHLNVLMLHLHTFFSQNPSLNILKPHLSHPSPTSLARHAHLKLKCVNASFFWYGFFWHGL